MKYYPTGLEWYPMRLGPHRDENGFASDVSGGRKIERRLERILGEWEDTPYSTGVFKKGLQGGVHCTAFLVAVLDELYGRSPTPLPSIPADAAMHDPKKARVAMRWFMRQYPDSHEVIDYEVEPGDVLVAGPSGGGPGHAMIVGPRRNTVWQASGRLVHYTGLYLPEGYELFHVRRFIDRERWGRN